MWFQAIHQGFFPSFSEICTYGLSRICKISARKSLASDAQCVRGNPGCYPPESLSQTVGNQEQEKHVRDSHYQINQPAYQ